MEYAKLGNIAYGDADAARALEQHLFQEFRAGGASLIPNGTTVTEAYFLARHHGLPTRLLDWTADVAAAAFFAAQDDKADGAVYCLQPRTLYPLDQWWEDVRWENDHLIDLLVCAIVGEANAAPVANIESLHRYNALPIRPNMKGSRLIRQDSRFTLHIPERQNPLDSETNKALKKWIVPRDSKKQIRGQLRRFGKTWRTLFPDLDNLVRDLMSIRR